MKDLSQGARMAWFVIYTIIWEVFIWCGTIYLIYFMRASSWLFLLAVIMSGAQFQPRSFGIETKEKRPYEMGEDDFKQYKKAMELQIKLEELKKENKTNKVVI